MTTYAGQQGVPSEVTALYPQPHDGKHYCDECVEQRQVFEELIGIKQTSEAVGRMFNNKE